MFRHTAALTGLICLCACASVQNGAGVVQDRISEVIADPAGLAMPGCVVGVSQKGQVAYTAASGSADIETERPLGTDTQFYAASVSKHFTAVAIMQLALAGDIDLDENVEAYLPELPTYKSPITVRMLVNHTSGVRDSLMLLILNGQMDWSVASRADALRLTYMQSQTDFDPGTQYAYSNGGYLLLSEIVERVSGMPFDQYMFKRLLEPLGMTRSYILSGVRPADTNLAHGYAVQNGAARKADDYPLFGGSGGLITTVEDLAKWDHDIDTGHKVWTPALLKLMTEPGRLANGDRTSLGRPGNYYASGLAVGPDWFSHGGAANGFRNFYARNQDARIGITLLCNRSDVAPDERTDQVLAIVDQGLPQIGLREGEVTGPTKEGAPDSAKGPNVGAFNLEGRYKSPDLDVIYELEAQAEDSLLLVVVGPDNIVRNSVPLKQTSEGVYKMGPIELRPNTDGQGFSLSAVRLEMHFDRIQ